MRALYSLVIAATLALPGSLEAQKLTPGSWTGSISPPDNAAMDATFDVSAAGDTTKITLKADGRAIEATDVKVESDRLLFTFSPGNNAIRCTLMLRDDKSYSGDCIDAQGAKGVIVMKPPKA
jgi:hypothetical protein